MSYPIPLLLSQRRRRQSYPLDFLAANVVGCWSTRQLLSTGGGNIIRGRDATTNEEDFTGAGYPTGVVTLASGGDAFCPQLYDQSGNGNHATQSTAASQPKGVDAGSLITDASGRPVMEFDGVGDVLTVPDSPVFDLTTAITVFCIAKNTAASVIANESLFGKYNASSGRREWWLYQDGNKLTVSFGVTVDGGFSGAYQQTGTQDLTFLKSYSFTFNSGAVVLYVDGNSVAGGVVAGSVPTSLHQSSAPVDLGNSNNSNFWSGNLNDFIIFDRVLTQSEITQLHNALA